MLVTLWGWASSGGSRQTVLRPGARAGMGDGLSPKLGSRYHPFVSPEQLRSAWRVRGWRRSCLAPFQRGPFIPSALERNQAASHYMDHAAVLLS